MQAEVPIVASAVGEIPWVLQNGRLGEVLPPKNPEVLAQAIISVYKNTRAAKKKATFAREVVLKRFSVEKMTMSYIQQYELLVA